MGVSAAVSIASIPGELLPGIASIGRQARRENEFTMTQMAPAFFDNKGAATMRQRAVSAIHNTQANLHQVFGREAIHMHR